MGCVGLWWEGFKGFKEAAATLAKTCITERQRCKMFHLATVQIFVRIDWCVDCKIDRAFVRLKA